MAQSNDPRVAATINVRIDEWLASRKKLERPNMVGVQRERSKEFDALVLRDLLAMSDAEIRELIYQISLRPTLQALALLLEIQQRGFHEIDGAGAEGLRAQLGSMYLGPIETFAHVPVELWQDLAVDYMDLVRDRIAAGQVVHRQDTDFRDIGVRSWAYEQKFAQMGYPGMMLGMGQ